MRCFVPILFASATLFVGACSSSKKLTAPSVILSLPDTLPTLPQSEIDIPVKIAGAALLKAADSMVPREFLSPRWPAYLQPSCDFRYRYRFVRSAFNITCTANHLSVSMSGSYQVAGGRCLCAAGRPVSPWVSGYCGFDKEPMRRIDFSFGTLLGIQPNYRLQAVSAVEKIMAIDRCRMSVFSMDMTDQITDSIRSSIAAFCKSFDASISAVGFGDYLKQTAKTWQKSPIGPYGWLAVNPVALRIGALNYSRDSFSLSLGISCRPELSSDKSPAKQVTLPPLSGGAGRNGISLFLPADYEYAFLSRLLADSLRDKSFPYKGKQVIIKDIAIKGTGHHQVELRIDFGGNYQGRIYLRGTPVIDTARQTLSVPDISYSLESHDLLVKMARTLLRGKIRKTVKGNSVLDLAALLKTNLPLLDAQLNRAITPNLHTRGEIRELKLIGLLAGEKNVQAQLFVQAELSLASTGVLK
jgi:hypothetical protein